MNHKNSLECNIKYLIEMAIQKHESGQWNEAKILYKQVLQIQPECRGESDSLKGKYQIQPNHSEALYGLGILAQQTGEFQEAEKFLSAASQVQPDSVKTWFSLGNLRQAQGQLLEAESAYKQAIALRQDAAPIYNNLGYTLQRQGKLDEAVACYRKALEVQPKCTEADVNLGNALHTQGKLSKDKQAHYAQLNYKLGCDRKNTGDLTTAEAYLQKALELNPNYGEVYMRLGEIYQTQKKLQEAAAAFQQGLKQINPHYAKAIEASEKAQIPQQIAVTPLISLEEVIVGNYRFPAIPSVADGTDKRPFWSVVVTVYNRRDYLLECLASVLAQWQGEEQMEIIVMDDASKTPVFDLVNSIGQGIIHYYRNRENLGLPGNWNAGVALTRGWWVHLLHDDDYILPSFYSRLQESLKECGDSIGAAFTGYQNINEKGEVILRQQVYGEQRGIAKNWLQRIGVSNLLNMSAVVIRREAHEQLGVYHPELTYTSDWEVYKRIAAVYDWWYEPEILARYRQHPNNVTSELLLTGKQMISIRSAIEMSESYFPTEQSAQITSQSRSYHFLYCLELALIPLQAGNLAGAWQVLEESLKIDRSPKAVAKLFSWLREEEATLLQEAGYIQTALTYYRQTIAIESDLPEVYYNLGSILQEQGEWEEAIAFYHQALKLNPQNWEIYTRLGQVYQAQNKITEAISVYRQGLILLNPHYAKAVAAYQDAGTTLEMLITPPIPQGEVTVGAYQFPAIPPVTNPEDPRPFWTVVIPVYNRTDYLLECLASVLVQWSGAEQMEILVMDNASTSPLFDLVTSIGGGVIRYYRNQQNIGGARNYNAGIALSRGQWVHVLHDDDCVLPGFYERLQQSLTTCPDSIGVACTGFEYINEKGKAIDTGEVVSLYGEHRGIMVDWLSHIGVCGLITVPAMVIRRTAHEQLGGYYPELPEIADWEIFKRFAVGYDWWYEPGILACYREHTQKMTPENWLSGKMALAIRRAIEISDTYLPIEHRAKITAKARSQNFNYCLTRAVIPLQAGNITGALSVLQEALKIDGSPQAVAKLFAWLTQDEAAPIREEIVTNLLAIPTELKLPQTAIAIAA